MADTLTVVCPNCSNEMRASVKHIGRKGRCAKCGNLVTIGAQESDRSTVTLNDKGAGDGGAVVSGTEVNPLLAGLIGLGATILLYAIFYALPRDNYLYVLMTQRSGIQHTITLVTCWGLAILVLKYIAVQRELRSTDRELELIPLEIGMQITPANVDKFLGHLSRLPPGEQDSILARRIRGALEHFKHRNNVSEVQSSLATQADIEASAVDSGYTLIRVFIWVCPILGFIGTVLGISQGVMKLANALPEAPAATAAAQPGPSAAPASGETSNKLITGIRLVTDDLATAFDTTLLGLVGVVLLMFPTEALKKTEYRMLDRVQGFVNESLLRRMAEGQQGFDDGMPTIVQQALDAAFKEHQRWLAQWQAQVAKLGSVIGADFELHVAAVQDKLSANEQARLAGVNEAVRRIEELFGQFGQATATWQKPDGDMKNALATVTQFHQALESNSAAMARVLQTQGELLNKYASADLTGAIRALSDVVARLREGGAPLPVLAPPPAGPPAGATGAVAEVQLVDRRPGLFGRILGRDSR